MSRVTSEYVPWVPKAQPSDVFPFLYDLKCIKSIEELKHILSISTDYMAFDTETTGLDAEEIDIVGYSFCLGNKNERGGEIAYYVPVWHFNFGLGDAALDLIYNKMCNTKTVAMFNMRYDVRVMEYHGYTKLYKDIVDKTETELSTELDDIRNKYIKNNKTCPYNSIEDLREKYKLDLSRKPYIKYDMSKVNVLDVQAIVYLVDTNIKYPSLKSSEEWYLGWRGASFEQTVSKAKNKNAITTVLDKKTGDLKIKNLNFFYLEPDEAYEYASVDALGTYLLGIKLQPYLAEAKTSGILDIKCLMPLTRFENELTLIDVDRLKSYSSKLSKKIKEVQDRCWRVAGREFNLGSNKDCNDVLKSLDRKSVV